MVPRLPAFRSLKTKLLILTSTLSLIPLAGISAFSYFIGSRQIAEDRIKLSLEKMAQDTADKIDLTLTEKREEIRSMGSTFPLLYPSLEHVDRAALTLLLNKSTSVCSPAVPEFSITRICESVSAAPVSISTCTLSAV